MKSRLSFKAIIIAIFAAVVLLVSCTKEPNLKSQIVGSWQSEEFYSKLYFNGEYVGEVVDRSGDTAVKFTFNSDNTGVATVVSHSVAETSSMNWDLVENDLIVTHKDGSSFRFTVDSCTSDTLVLSIAGIEIDSETRLNCLISFSKQ